MNKELEKMLKRVEKETQLELIYVRNLPEDASYSEIENALRDDRRLLEDTFQEMLRGLDDAIQWVWNKVPVESP